MQSMWEKLAVSIGRADLISDPRYATNLDRVTHAADLDGIIGTFIADRTLDDNLAFFEKAGVTVGPICDPSQLIDHEYIRGRDVIEDYPDPELGKLPLHTPFPRLSETPGTVRSPAPEIGQHNAEFIAELDLQDMGDDWLGKAGVI